MGHKSPSFPAVEAYGLHMHSPFNWSSLVRFTHDSYGMTSTDGAMVGILRSDGFVTWMYEDAPMMFGTNNVERLRITNTGNVGIGTVSPTHKLEVIGSAKVDNYLNVGDGTSQVAMFADGVYGRGSMGLGSTIESGGSNRHLRILTPTDGGPGTVSIGYFKAPVGAYWNRALSISNAPAIPHLMLQPDSGNVVIGTTADPGHRLHVEGDTNTSGIFRVGGVAGWTGTIFIATNPPGQQNISVVGGIITGLS